MGIISTMCIKKKHEYKMKALMEREKSLKKKIKELEMKPLIPKEESQSKNSSIELTISCQNLHNMDDYGLSDPVCYIYQVSKKYINQQLI